MIIEGKDKGTTIIKPKKHVRIPSKGLLAKHNQGFQSFSYHLEISQSSLRNWG